MCHCSHTTFPFIPSVANYCWRQDTGSASLQPDPVIISLGMFSLLGTEERVRCLLSSPEQKWMTVRKKGKSELINLSWFLPIYCAEKNADIHVLLSSPLHPIVLLSKISLHQRKKVFPKKKKNLPRWHWPNMLSLNSVLKFLWSSMIALKGGSNDSRGEHISHANPPTEAKNH